MTDNHIASQQISSTDRSQSNGSRLQGTELSGNILTPQGWITGSIQFDERINSIKGDTSDPKQNNLVYILPGFIDFHVHGAGGKDTMEAGDAIQVIAKTHAQYGTTSMLATTMTAPMSDLITALHGINVAVLKREKGMARVLGVHLEGPYINPDKLGAQPDYVQKATLADVQTINAIAPIKLITVAPEIGENLQLVRDLTHMGMKVQLGHSSGTYEDAVAAIENGAAGFTHLFNAMSRLDHRAPGMVGAAFAHANYSEIIPDLLHVHPGAIKAALRAIPHLYCVTDSTAATGMPDGDYLLGRQVVHKCLGGVRLDDGTLAGSTLTMDQAFRNLVSLGLDIAEASLRVSTFAADYLGLSDRGRLQARKYADLVVLDRNLNLIAVYVEGEKIEFVNA